MSLARPRDLYDLMLLLMIKLGAWCLTRQRLARTAMVAGSLSYKVRSNSRRRIADNLTAALGGEIRPHEIGTLARKTFQYQAWHDLSFSAASRRDMRERVRIHGLEHLDEALLKGRGAILWESLFADRFFAKAALVERGYPLLQVHSQDHGGSASWLGRKIVRRVYRRLESRLIRDIVDISEGSIGYLRLLIDRLARNGIVCVCGVGGEGQKRVAVDFFGAPHYFPTGTVTLAKLTGASIIPMFGLERDSTSFVVLEEPIDLHSGGSRDEALTGAVTQYVRVLESYIRRYPDQWYVWSRLPRLSKKKAAPMDSPAGANR